MTIILIIILLLLCGAGILLRHYGIALFNIVWALILFICRKELRMNIYELTLALLFLMVLMVNVGYAAGIYWRSKKKLHVSSYHLNTECDYSIVTTFFIICGAIFLYYAIWTICTYGFDLINIRKFNNAANDASVFRSEIDTVLFYGVATPILYMLSLVLCYNLCLGKEIPLKNIIFLIIIALLQMITTGGGRSIFIRIALFVFAALLWKFFSGWRPNKAIITRLLAVVAILWLLMELFTLIRNKGEISFIGQAFSYIRGSVAHMQYRLSRLNGPQYYSGYAAFGGFLYYPINLINAITGWSIPTSSDLLVYLQSQREIQLSDQTMLYNAIVPNAFYFFFDNGYTGVIVFSAMEGFFLSFAEKMYRRPTFLWFVGWATCVYMIAYSALDGVLWTFRHPTTILYCLAFHRLIYHMPDQKHSAPIQKIYDHISILKGEK